MKSSSVGRSLVGAWVVLIAGCSCPSGGGGTHKTLGSIIRKDPRFDKLIPPGAEMEVLAGGFEWTEGPLWIKEGGYLLFSVIPPNKVCKWKDGDGVSIYLKPSGLSGPKDLRPEPGSNGLILDPKGNLVLCQHGDRRMARRHPREPTRRRARL